MGFYAEKVFPLLMERGINNRKVGKDRSTLLAGVQGKILEIGFGTGLNIHYYPPHVSAITILEPSPAMHDRARRRIAEHPVRIDFVSGSIEQAPFDDNSFDSIVSTFTLCSVSHISRALCEIRRLLKPGGTFYFLEHGYDRVSFMLQMLQKITVPLYWLLGEGCRTQRRFDQLIAASGLHIIDLNTYRNRNVFPIANYFYRGLAVKKG